MNLKQQANRGYLKTEGASVDEDTVDVNDISESQTDEEFSSEYIDIEKLDDEKMAELLEDHEALLHSDDR